MTTTKSECARCGQSRRLWPDGLCSDCAAAQYEADYPERDRSIEVRRAEMEADQRALRARIYVGQGPIRR